MVTLGQALAAKMQFEVRDRRDGVTEVQTRSTRTGKVVSPKLGAAVLHAAGVRGVIQRTEDTFVVADSAFARAEAEAFERRYASVVSRLKTRLYEDDVDEFPTAYIVGCHIYVDNGQTTEALTGEEALRYLVWLDVGHNGMPSEWRAALKEAQSREKR